jgi:hypothetical protein
MADGTAPKCGRVGSCHIYLNEPFRNEGLFYLWEGREIGFRVLGLGFWVLGFGFRVLGCIKDTWN